MSALRRVTTPPIGLVEAVTKSLRTDYFPESLPKISHIFDGPPPGCERSFESLWIAVISPSSLVSSGSTV
jgi:hypothetical protein